MLAAIRSYLVSACLFFAFSPVSAEIIVESLQDKATYVNRVGFRVKLEEGFRYEARLDGRLVAPQFWQFATQGYHQFVVTRTNIETSDLEMRSYRFVVQDAVRGNSEWGLRPWTPHPLVDSSDAEFQNAQVELTYPKSIPKNISLPIIAWIRDDGGQARRVNGTIALGENSPKMTIRRGVGSTRIQLDLASSQVSATAKIAGLKANWTVKQESDPDWVRVSGTIAENTIWEAHSRILVEGNLLILPETSLTIEAGVVMAMAGGVDITVAGSLHVEGTPDEPTLITPLNEDEPWGGFLLMNEPATANIAHTIITGSGAHRTWYFANRGNRSHRPEQAAFHFGRGTTGHFDHVYLIENAGQALHGENASITIDHSLVQKCQTVGQFNEGAVTIRSSAFIEFPVEDAQFVDGDNDGFYFTFGTHQISDSLIGWTKDDGIDAGGNDPGQVTVERCWIESCFHEGMALSGKDKIVSVKDTVFLNNGQGVEAGYLSPRVNVADSLFTSNLVGLRFGDNYFREHSGSLTASGSISVFNDRDVWGLTANLWAEDLSKMTIEGNIFSDVPESF
ncbi:MAG: right-handed parallel beta-helix repeat-containing protein, partial [Verrucomicrobia bacterium]|nr:right-handed parallel beta-helix repeat-containing protein [Verrucomicrobiota bacterium]